MYLYGGAQLNIFRQIRVVAAVIAGIAVRGDATRATANDKDLRFVRGRRFFLDVGWTRTDIHDETPTRCQAREKAAAFGVRLGGGCRYGFSIHRRHRTGSPVRLLSL